ncbi:hypothetical protein J6590_003555 [Homalodisca vitripennis]|nr:hypothetical protein J6590_003555 [Homalodisca vitripennis]
MVASSQKVDVQPAADFSTTSTTNISLALVLDNFDLTNTKFLNESQSNKGSTSCIDQRFPNGRSRPTSGSRAYLSWVAA